MYENTNERMDLTNAIIQALANNELTDNESDILLLSLNGEGWETIRRRVKILDRQGNYTNYKTVEAVMKAYHKAAVKLRKYMI